MDKYDVVIVGAGLAGLAAAYYLASRGYDVIVLEKAKVPGQKNVTGGVIYGSYIKGYGLIDLIPDFEKEAPLERRIVDFKLVVLSDPFKEGDRYKYRVLEIGRDSPLYSLIHYPAETGHDYSVLRARFDRWLALKVEEVGGIVVTGVGVEDAVIEDGRVVGVVTHRGEEVRADLVIDASGVTSVLAPKVGLRPYLTPSKVYHGVKFVYRLDEEAINRRFNVKSGEGVAIALMGDFLRGMVGGGFIYTNKDTLSIGIVVEMSSMLDALKSRFDEVGKPLDVLEDMVSHPYVASLIEGGKLVEYSAHLVPRGFEVMPSKPFVPGYIAVGDALGSFVKIGDMIDGMRRAIATGIMAAQTYEYARKIGDFGNRGLSIYLELLKPIIDDMNKYRSMSALFESRLIYGSGYRVALRLLGREVEVARFERGERRDTAQRLQELTGLLTYDEDKEYSHITVNYDEANKDPYKLWVAACPMGCYSLYLEDKGVFVSFHDLYKFNLRMLSQRTGRPASELRDEAIRETLNDIKRGSVKFDHVACVACGTCWVIGPPSTIRFGPEREGHGVKYAYG